MVKTGKGSYSRFPFIRGDPGLLVLRGLVIPGRTSRGFRFPGPSRRRMGLERTAIQEAAMTRYQAR
jgi:hypothetical protein